MLTPIEPCEYFACVVNRHSLGFVALAKIHRYCDCLAGVKWIAKREGIGNSQRAIRNNHPFAVAKGYCPQGVGIDALRAEEVPVFERWKRNAHVSDRQLRGPEFIRYTKTKVFASDGRWDRLANGDVLKWYCEASHSWRRNILIVEGLRRCL